MFWVQVSHGASNQAFCHSLKKENITLEVFPQATMLCYAWVYFMT